jgi:hypothetical protein
MGPRDKPGDDEILENVDEQQGFRGGQPQIEIRQIWRTKLTPFPL